MSRAGRATSFGAATEAYERARPSYPLAAVRWLLPAHAQDVVDAGAGTGKLTRSLVGDGRTVVAVDPDPEMLAALAAALPGVRTRVGRAESLPLADACADALTFGQAWHWVDPPAACAEAARVLRPGGTLGLIWNIRDESTSWVARLTSVMHGSDAERLLAGGGPTVTAPFGPPEHRTEAWTMPASVDDLVALAASRSYVITAQPDERTRILAGVRALAEEVADATGTVQVPYVTHAFRATRP